MENNAKVFSSDITRGGTNYKNNLYDLLDIVPAKPVKLNDIKTYTCDYTPKTGKQYIPKKKSRLKVRTVRDIRKTFEQDVYSHLIPDLITQQNILFKKIRRGSSRDDNTKKLATNILKGDAPILRSTWQMLTNLNPEQQKYSRQFVLWNGKLIQVNGSIGGMKKLICNYDLASNPQCVSTQNYKNNVLKQREVNRKKRLLRSSVAVKFKPGPLCKKEFLDNSHQKYHVGNIELINLPKLGLDVLPKYGTTFETSITYFLNNFRNENGVISQKWAELAVTVLGTLEDSKAVQLNRNCVTFDLAYKYNQNRLLMRRDMGRNTSEVMNTGIIFTNPRTIETSVELEVEDMVHKMLDAVEISLTQDTIFTQEQELKMFPSENVHMCSQTHVKDKSKRKFGELDRLDVTVITLPETKERNLTKSCSKLYCSLGCICESLESTYNLKQHCGRVECMFDCQCGFTKYKSDLSYTGSTERFPGLSSIDNKVNSSLAKEEQKFHQTVIVTGEKTILLKGEKRNVKTSKKYADFYNNMSLKKENQKVRNLSIVALKLNCDNIEPWCMVHELYKCFCKGKFTDTCALVPNDALGKEPLSTDGVSNIDYLDNSITNDINNIEERERRKDINLVKKSKISDNAHTKSNKIHTSRSIYKTTDTNKITEKLSYSDSENKTQINRISFEDAGTVHRGSTDIININAGEGRLTRRAVRKLHRQQYSSNEINEKETDFKDSRSMFSSRTNAYEGRKYSNGYYRNTNYKISTMEKNDKRLQERLSFLYNKCCENDTITKPPGKTQLSARLQQLFSFEKNKKDKDPIPAAKRKRLSNDSNLVTWLESNYKMYRERNDRGLLKKSLEPPQHGKVALHPWSFILNRYRERKNLFLVSRQPPFRIFMAVNTVSPIFENCIDINDIRFADLHKYPTTVKNLLINATELNDSFCILRGLAFCWELIGSVSKIEERNEEAEQEDTPEINIELSDMDKLLNQNNSVVRGSEVNNIEQRDIETLDVINQGSSEDNNVLFENAEHTETVTIFSHNSEIRNSFIESVEQYDLDKIENSGLAKLLHENLEQKDNLVSSESLFESSAGCSDVIGSSKWFVMTIENDFSEIRFFRKGFFVKYLSIINAISVARLSGKTVRLSSKKCIEQTDSPQFGIYAIPNDNEYCVFVGPYEMEDTLGIETIKTVLDVRRLKRTRGFWITTNKIDNLKVVENPLSFVALKNNQINSIPIETHFNANDGANKGQVEKPDMQENLPINKIEEFKESSPYKKGQIKIVKPIKIRKTNGFYHLASDGVLKKISLQYPQSTAQAMPVILKSSLNTEDNGVNSLLKPKEMSNDLNRNQIPEISQVPFAEASTSAASQIRISAVFSTQNDDPIAKRTNQEKGMFILKPEEINRRLVQNKLADKKVSCRDGYNINDGTTNISLLQPGPENDTIEKHHSVSDTEWCNLNDVFVISDDESDKTSDTVNSHSNIWTDVWIECKNIPNIGWISGIKNFDNLLSFKIPGYEFSEFYPEQEAFTKINS